MPKQPAAPRPTVLVKDDLYFTLPQLVVYSGMSRRTLEGHMRAPVHPLPFYKVGSKILIRRSEFDAWMKQFRREADHGEQIIDELLKGL